MWFGIVTLFPEMFATLNFGVTGRAIKDQLITLQTWNPRDFATDKHKSVDDRPYGGGSGMVMMTEPLIAAIKAAKKAAQLQPTVIYLSPQGKKLTQHYAAELATKRSLILVSGRYEGIDERIIEHEIDEECSIGDYILSGGELPAMVTIDVVSRLIPGVLGNKNSAAEDSLTSGLLKYPQYTRPEVIGGSNVPDVLLSGHHEQITRWRRKKSLGKTWLQRPDLLIEKGLNKEEHALLMEFIDEFLQK